jgi:hypothetical protein
MWLNSSAKVATVMGHLARNVYVNYIETSGIAYEPIISAGRIWGYVELQEHAITRVVVFMDHIDYMKQFKTRAPQLSEVQRIQAVQERLLDLVNVIAYGKVVLPASLVQNGNYFMQWKRGMVIPRTAFQPGHEAQIRAMVRNGNIQADGLRQWMERTEQYSEQEIERVAIVAHGAHMSLDTWVNYLKRQIAAGDANSVSMYAAASNLYAIRKRR